MTKTHPIFGTQSIEEGDAFNYVNIEPLCDDELHSIGRVCEFHSQPNALTEVQWVSILIAKSRLRHLLVDLGLPVRRERRSSDDVESFTCIEIEPLCDHCRVGGSQTTDT